MRIWKESSLLTILLLQRNYSDELASICSILQRGEIHETDKSD
jgi:hypothetical protein